MGGVSLVGRVREYLLLVLILNRQDSYSTSHLINVNPRLINSNIDLKMPTDSASSSGIVVDKVTGQRHVPPSTRADGTKRKEIRIRPGYQPPEDVKKYKNPSAEAWKSRGNGGVPGAEPVSSSTSSTTASNKNAKRREARKKAKAGEETGAGAGATSNEAHGSTETKEAVNVGEADAAAPAAVDPEAEKEKKARNLKKKLRQARELREKKDKGESLLPEQFAKVIKINELIRELDALGFDEEGERKPSSNV